MIFFIAEGLVIACGIAALVMAARAIVLANRVLRK